MFCVIWYKVLWQTCPFQMYFGEVAKSRQTGNNRTPLVPKSSPVQWRLHHKNAIPCLHLLYFYFSELRTWSEVLGWTQKCLLLLTPWARMYITTTWPWEKQQGDRSAAWGQLCPTASVLSGNSGDHRPKGLVVKQNQLNLLSATEGTKCSISMCKNREELSSLQLCHLRSDLITTQSIKQDWWGGVLG